MAGTRISRRSMLGTAGLASLAPVFPLDHPAPAFVPHPAVRSAFAGDLQVGPVPCGTSSLGAVAITGGTIRGRTLAGTVNGGHIQWQRQAEVCEVTARFDVRCADGSLQQVIERGVHAAGADMAQGAAFSAIAEVLGPDGEAAALSSLLVGRLDTTRMHAGVVRLLAFEVC